MSFLIYAQTMPIASFEISPENPQTGEIITFDASSSYGGTPPYKITWDFGTGYIDYDSSSIIQYYYTSVGSYNVILEIEDANGQKSSYSKWIYVSEYIVEDEFEPNNIFEDAAELSFPFNHGELYQYDDDWYKFYTPGRFELRLVCLEDHQLHIEIRQDKYHLLDSYTLESYENELAINRDYGSKWIYILVYGSNEGAQYGLSIRPPDDDYAEPNNNMYDAYFLNLPFSRDYFIQNDDDWFGFSINVLSTVIINVRCDYQDILLVEVFDYSGSKIIYGWINEQNDRIVLERNYNAGNYYIKISGDNIGVNYSLEIFNVAVDISVDSGGDSGGTTDNNTNTGPIAENPFEINGFPAFYTALASIAIISILIKKKKH